MRRSVALPITIALASSPMLLMAPAAQAADTATVSVLHAVPGLTVDVYANGEELLPNFAPGTLTDPLSLPADTYDLAVFADGEGPSGTPAIEANGVEVPAGANASIVAHLDAGGKPKLSVFVNDTSAVPAGKARLTVRHTAAAPAVDVRAGGTPVIEGLTNPNERSLEVPAGTIEADVTLAGTDTVAIGPASLDLADGSNTVVYAWGNAEAGYKLATQSVGDPSGVGAGEIGLADTSLPAWQLGLMAVAALGLAGAGVGLASARRPV